MGPKFSKIVIQFFAKEELSLKVSARKNQSKFQNNAFLLVDIQIWIDFYVLASQEKEAFKLDSSS